MMPLLPSRLGIILTVLHSFILSPKSILRFELVAPAQQAFKRHPPAATPN